MSRNRVFEKVIYSKVLLPEVKTRLNKFKMEAAKELVVDLSEDYKVNLTSRENT